MSIGQAFLEALESLNGNKLRSGLTVLGIVIGVAAVIAMLAVGQGAQASITGSISGIGTNLLFVFRGDPGDNVRKTLIDPALHEFSADGFHPSADSCTLWAKARAEALAEKLAGELARELPAADTRRTAQ